jgi:hypothetical protein
MNTPIFIDQFARVVVGYHGCTEQFLKALLLRKTQISDWRPSLNEWDWLGNGIYFWEHAPERALRWARERFTSKRQRPAVIGAYIQLGRCFDLLNETFTSLLGETYERLARTSAEEGGELPKNRGREWKFRQLDRLVINDCIDALHETGIHYDTVRGAFLEGEPVYPTAGFSRASHIQIAVRNSACILGVFLPNLRV